MYNYYINNINEKFEGKSSKNYVYDIFNKNSDFFTSPCAPFTSKYGADILNKDRYKIYYTEINFCEENCTYLGVERSVKNKEENFILIKCLCDLKDKYFTENEIKFGANFKGEASDHNINFQTIQSNFICFKKLLNFSSIFTKENILGLVTLICFILILVLYIAQCMIGTTRLEETLNFIRIGKYDHGLKLFLNLKDYIKEQRKRDACYQRRKELKKVRLMKEKKKNMTLIQAQHKIKKAENNIKRKFEGKEMIPDEKKDELEIIREHIKELEEQLKLKYERKGMKDKKIKIRIKEDPTDIKKINQEIKISKKRLEDLRKQKKEIELEKLKYHSFSSMGSLPPQPPKRILSELPMLDEIDDDLEITSKEKIVMKKHNKKLKKKETKKINKEEEKEKEKEDKKENNNKNSILSINKNINKEEIKEENEEEDKNDEKKEEEKNSVSSWETYDSKDSNDKNKKEKKKSNKRNKDLEEQKKREIQLLLIERRIKEIEKRIELLPEEAAKQKRLLQIEKKKKEMLEKGLPFKEEDFQMITTENILNTEEKKEENNINNEITKNDEIPEENLSKINEDKDESEDNDKISEQKTQVKKVKKKKDAFFKSILNKNYQFKYMRLFYEERPYNFARDYSIINFNDLFTSNDFFYIYVDVEMNEMIYRRALKEDNRSFCSMYWCFLKYKNNFIFCVTKDYFNIITVKIAILIYSLSIYPLFSCLFINDNLIHKMYVESNIIKKHTILSTDAISIVQYIFTPIFIDLIVLFLKKFILTEKDIIDFIHKKKYHSNYVLQEMVKNHDVRDEKDEEEKNKILKNIQNSNKSKVEKAAETDAYFALDDNQLKEQSKIDYEKEYEENRTIINEIRFKVSTYPEKVNNRTMFFFIGAFLLSFFNFYYVTLFTMVYYNCNKKIILGTVIPLIVNFIYPFINCLIFVSLRYFALNKGYINLYKFSRILSYI